MVYIIVEGERHIQRKRERIKLMPGRAEAVHRSKDSPDESVDGVARENHQLKRRPKLTFFLCVFPDKRQQRDEKREKEKEATLHL